MTESTPVVDSYLALLSAVADCVGLACPPVGTPHRHRLARLRSRLEYDLDGEEPDTEMMQQITQGICGQLTDYSRQAAVYLDRHDLELRRVIEHLFETVQALGAKQNLSCDQFRLPGAGIDNCVDSLRFDWQSLLNKMRDQLVEADRRIAQCATADPLTGLMNRGEMERHIEMETAEGRTPTLIRFTVDQGLPAEIVQQVAHRLISQFRHNDLVARWSGHEFLILFRSPPEIASSRTEQILPWIEGRYLARNGDRIEVHAEGGLIEHELAPSR